MTRLLLLACLLSVAQAAAAQSMPPASESAIEPDRPDITNGAHLVSPGVLQLEFGGIDSHTATLATLAQPVASGNGKELFGTPFTFRLGVTKWLEARLGGDGLLIQTGNGPREVGFGNVQLGAKVGFFRDGDGAARVSLLPSVNIPTASADKGLGSGDADFTIAILTGADLGARAHADVNYGIGTIGAGGGAPHFTQHTASISVSVPAGRWSPYGELYWISRQEPDGSVITAVDAGAIYARSPRLAFDGGVLIGVSRSAPDYGFFAGLSIELGRLGYGAPGAKFRQAVF